MPYHDKFNYDNEETFVLLGDVKKEVSKSNHIASYNELGLYYDSDSECKNKNSISLSRVTKKFELDHI